MWHTENADDCYEIRDTVRGVVSTSTQKGVYLYLENGQGAYAEFGKLPSGTKVLCTVLKSAEEYWLPLVSIDGVADGGLMTA